MKIFASIILGILLFLMAFCGCIYGLLVRSNLREYAEEIDKMLEKEHNDKNKQN